MIWLLEAGRWLISAGLEPSYNNNNVSSAIYASFSGALDWLHDKLKQTELVERWKKHA